MTKAYSNLDPAISDYVETLYGEDLPELDEIRERADREGLPDIHVGRLDGRLMGTLARAMGVRRVVEIGTLAGYSGVILARALPPGGRLHTFEFQPKHAEVAQTSFQRSGVAERVTVHVGPALANLPNIEREGPFDLVFIDADKANYPAYLEWAAQNLRIGGSLLADNTFAFGCITERPSDDPNRGSDIAALQQFNRQLAQDSRFFSVILPTAEGLSLAVRVA